MTAAPLPGSTPYPAWESQTMREAAYAALWDLPASFPLGMDPQTGEQLVVADLTAKLDAKANPPGFVLWYLNERGLLLQPVRVRGESW